MLIYQSVVLDVLSPGVLLMRLATARRTLALRRGVWHRVRPRAKALIDAVLLHFERRREDEVATCGTPCVAYAVGGLKEAVVHGETGYLVKPHDTDALAKTVTDMLKDPRAAYKMGEKASQHSEKFS